MAWLDQFSFKPKFILQATSVVLFVTLLSGGVFFFGYNSIKQVSELEEALLNNRQQSGHDFEQVVRHFGYGGFIHHFKNYILRRDPDLLGKVGHALQNLQQALDTYESHVHSVSEREALAQIKNTVNEYAAKFALAQQLDGIYLTPIELDALVKVDDSAAFKALRSLQHAQQQHFRAQELATQAKLIPIIDSLFLGMLFVPLALIGNLVLFFAFKRFWRQHLLQEAEQAFVQLVPDAILCVAPNSKILQVNQQAEQIFGYTRQELLSFYIADLLPESIREQHSHCVQDYFNNPSSRFMALGREVTGLRADGREIPIEISLSHFQRDDYRLAIVVVRDMTRRRQAEESLRRSEERLRLSQHIGHIGTWEWDIRTDEIFWSDETYSVFGLDPQRVSPSYDLFLNCLPPEDRERVQEAVNIALEKREPYHIEHRILRPDGNECAVLEQGEAEYDETGEPVRMLGIVQDISSRKAAENALRESEERFRSAFDAAAHGMALVSLDGHFLRINRTLLFLTGYSKSELLSRNLSSFAHPDDWVRTQLSMRRLLAGEIESSHLENRYFHQLGHILWSLLSISLVRDSLNQPVHFVFQFQDISERKAFESKLREAKEQAESASRAKSTFLANMSHELRTPLNGILGYAQLLQGEELSAEQLDKIAMIRHSGEHLLTLIEDILDLSKIEAGRFELFNEDFDLPTLLDNLSKLFSMRARDKGIDFHCQIKNALPEIVHGDGKRLRQILINLLGNAVKFTDSGEVRLSLSYEAPWLSVMVEDTGIGMEPGVLHELFKPFQQFGNQQFRALGTGLGLSISRKLVELMGGQLEVESQPQKGSVFRTRLLFPAAARPTARQAQTEESSNRTIAGYRSARERAPYRILVADDQLESRRLLRDLLTPLGFQIHEAKDGEQALREAQNWRPDLILMDIVMPRLDGLAAVRAIRAHADGTDVPIIAVSAKVFAEDRDNSLQAGCQAHLAKPVNTNDLLSLLANYLELEWTYHAAPEVDKPGAVKTSRRMTVPPDLYEHLMELTRRGRIQDLRREAKRLREDAPQLEDFCKRLEKLLASFNLKEIRVLLDAYREE